MTDLNRIEKEIVLRAPRARVWRAIADADEFGAWFRMKLEGQFEVGRSVTGKLTIPGYEHLTVDLLVERMEPEDLFSYRWHPGATDPAVDYSAEPTTLVEFMLKDVPEGTMLTVVESGFDRLPAERRDLAFRMNDNGWTGQIKNIQRYVDG